MSEQQCQLRLSYLMGFKAVYALENGLNWNGTHCVFTAKRLNAAELHLSAWYVIRNSVVCKQPCVSLTIVIIMSLINHYDVINLINACQCDNLIPSRRSLIIKWANFSSCSFPCWEKTHQPSPSFLAMTPIATEFSFSYHPYNWGSLRLSS